MAKTENRKALDRIDGTRQVRSLKPGTPTPGFAIQIKDDTELGLAMLVAEDEEGHYEPVGVVVSINEAREIAAGDMSGRMRRLERGSNAGLCPYEYKVWAQGIDGDYRVASTINAASLP
jgi:hypothetical protein